MIDVSCALPDDLRAYLGYLVPSEYRSACFLRSGDAGYDEMVLQSKEPPSPLRGERLDDPVNLADRFALADDTDSDEFSPVLAVSRAGGSLGPFKNNLSRAECKSQIENKETSPKSASAQSAQSLASVTPSFKSVSTTISAKEEGLFLAASAA